MAKVNQDPFSNGEDFRWWSARNCDKCIKSPKMVVSDLIAYTKCRMSAVFIGTESGENIFCPITLSGSRIGWSRDQAIYNVTHWMSILE